MVYILCFQNKYSVLKSIRYFLVEIVFRQFRTTLLPNSIQYCFCFISILH